MFLLLLAVATAASPSTPDPAVTISTLQACVARVSDEYKAGDALPSRLKAASEAVDRCVTVADADHSLLMSQLTATAAQFRAERARIDEATRRQPVQTAVTSSPDPQVQAELDRARAKLAPQPVENVTAELTRLAVAVDTQGRQLGAVGEALKAARAEGQRYLTTRDGLWVMACNGEIELRYPETMPADARYSYEEQCRQLRSRTVASNH